MKQSKKLVTKIVAVAVAFSMTVAFVPAKADAASKNPTLSKTKATIELGSIVTLKVKKNKTTIKSTKWTTSDKDVATVSKKGVVKSAGSLGKATIKATVKYKSGKKTKTAKLSCKVTVKDWAQVDPTVSPELKASIDKYFSTISGINVVPFAELAYSKSQNAYRVFCKCNKVVENPVEYYAIYDFYLDKNGDVKSNPKYADAEGVIDVYPTESSIGGFTEATDQLLITEHADEINKAVKEKEIPYTPVALLAQQGSPYDGNFVAICKREVTGGNKSTTKAGYFLVGISLDVAGILTGNIDVTINFAKPITLADEDYIAATDIDPRKVEEFATQVKSAFIKDDRKFIANNIDYPIDILNGESEIHVETPEQFLALDLAFPSEFIEKIKKLPCMHMFVRDIGISLGGEGLVWIGEGDGEGELKIYKINLI